MALYKVEVKKTIRRFVFVEADSGYDAHCNVELMCEKEEIVLDDNDFVNQTVEVWGAVQEGDKQ